MNITREIPRPAPLERPVIQETKPSAPATAGTLIPVVFISRHEPTPEQAALMRQENRALALHGDADAFSDTAVAEIADRWPGRHEFAVVNAAMAMQLAAHFAPLGGCRIWVFENARRPLPGSAGTFAACGVRSWDIQPGGVIRS